MQAVQQAWCGLTHTEKEWADKNSATFFKVRDEEGDKGGPEHKLFCHRCLGKYGRGESLNKMDVPENFLSVWLQCFEERKFYLKTIN